MQWLFQQNLLLGRSVVHVQLLDGADGVLGEADLHTVCAGLENTAAWPLSTAAVCFGTFAGGGLSAFLQKSRGLVCGAVEGLLMAGLLLALLFGHDGVPEPAHELRCAMTLCAGCLGGYCGMLWSEKHRRRNF